MKPDWKDAPEWAKWLAMDDDGRWHWWEEKPFWNSFIENWISGEGRVKRVGSIRAASQTLEPRPEAKP